MYTSTDAGKNDLPSPSVWEVIITIQTEVHTHKCNMVICTISGHNKYQSDRGTFVYANHLNSLCKLHITDNYFTITL